MALLVAAGSPPGKTQVASPYASDPKTLGTLVNSIEGGNCNSGTCAIMGGTSKGNKLFHRLTEFWAHSGISKVTIDNDQSSSNPINLSFFPISIQKAVISTLPLNLRQTSQI